MKLLLTAFCAAMFTSPLAFADKCEKSKCDKDKDESTLVAEAGKCDKGKCDKDKDESTLVTVSTTADQLAHCGKCGKGEKHEKGEKKEEAEKEKGTLIAGKDCEKSKCDKDKNESTILA